MEEYLDEIHRIRAELERHPEGLSITDIAGLLGMNRNSVAKYMDILQIQGAADGRKRGTSKIYYLSHRMPVASIKKICSRPFILLDKDCMVIDHNPGFSRVTGIPSNEINGQVFDKLPFKFAGGESARQIARAALRGMEQRVSAQIANADAKSVTLTLIPLVFETGKPGTAVIIENFPADSGEGQDERARPELFKLLDRQVEYAVRYSPEGIIQYVNEPFCRAIARSREDLIGRPFKHLVSADDDKRIKANRARLSMQYPAGMIEFRAIMANGEARWQRWWDHAFYDDRGQLIGYFSCGLDITDEVSLRTKLKKSQKMLEENIASRTSEFREINRQLYEEMTRRENMEQQLLRTQFAMDNAADMVFWVNRNARIDYANRAALAGSGYTSGEIPELALNEIFVIPVSTWSESWNHLKEKGTVSFETDMITKEGSRIPIEIVVRYLEYHVNEFACCFCRDISERSRMEHTLHLANRKLNVLTSFTRHDIQNKITVLLGYVERAKKQEKDPVVISYLERQERAAKAIRDKIAITRDFKDLGAEPPEWIQADKVVMEMLSRYKENSVRFEVNLPVILVYADRQIERVFSRLIEIAVNSRPVPPEIRIYSRKEPERMVLVIEYTGEGIRPDDKERIFEPEMEGTGMQGLFILREILSLTDITLEETGEFGEKTRFEIGIPRVSLRQGQNH